MEWDLVVLRTGLDGGDPLKHLHRCVWLYWQRRSFLQRVVPNQVAGLVVTRLAINRLVGHDFELIGL